MSRQKPIQINIPHPCSQNWDEMTPSGNGRFCDHCQKTVIDFTKWSDGSLHQFFSNNKEHVCGRFLGAQINRPISIPYQSHSRLYRLTVALGLTLIASASNTGSAQTRKVYVISSGIVTQAQKLTLEQLFPSDEESELFELISCIEGYIFHKTKPAPGIRVEVSQKGIEIASVTSDASGHYKLLLPRAGHYDVLFSSEGCDSIQITDVLVLQNGKIIQNVTMPTAAIEDFMGIVSNPHIKSDKRSFSFQTIRKLPTKK